MDTITLGLPAPIAIFLIVIGFMAGRLVLERGDSVAPVAEFDIIASAIKALPHPIKSLRCMAVLINLCNKWLSVKRSKNVISGLVIRPAR
ncbi:hypothetical protein ACFSFZ_14180 [Mixta tenebrionis]|uniref:hypothetical protein n=1 Tax=Mixta tenebrionis TaxID=2562439 RepID=UPI001FEABEDC|nr:hypothetical protein [Mixta tenebrionis]